ncbi:recombination endonuclease subunit [Vibrio phage vB_VcorM_GR28A]|nr:recombination endonuclease subunit [Vibrio phage vB_VcorM_GR28A]
MSELDDFINAATGPAEELQAPFAVAAPNVVHKLHFDRVRAKNFRSIGNEFIELDFNKHRSLLVVSDENGSGKSTLSVWATYYALTGKPYEKRDKVTALVNSASGREMLVELEFRKGGNQYKIRRGRKGTIEFDIQIMTDDGWKTIAADAAKADWQAYLWELLGLDPKQAVKIIENVVILGKEKYQPFIEMGAEDRRNMIEPIWDLGIFTRWNAVIKEKLPLAKKALATAVESSNEALMTLGHAESSLERAQKVVVDAENNLEHSRGSLKAGRVPIAARWETAKEVDESVEAVVTTMEVERDKRVSELQKRIEAIDSGRQAAVEQAVAAVSSKRAALQASIETEEANYTEQVERIKAEAAELKKAFDEEHADTPQKLAEQKKRVDELRQVGVDTESELEALRTDPEALQAALNRDKVNESVKKMNGFVSGFEAKIELKEDDIQKLRDLGDCPTCGQHVTEDWVERCAQAVQPEIDELNDKLQKAKDTIEKYGQQLNEAEDILEVNAKAIECKRGELEAVKQNWRDAQRDLNLAEQAYRTAAANMEDLHTQSESKLDAMAANHERKLSDLRNQLSDAEEASTRARQEADEKVDGDIGIVQSDIQKVLDAHLKDVETRRRDAAATLEQCETELNDYDNRVVEEVKRLEDKLEEVRREVQEMSENVDQWKMNRETAEELAEKAHTDLKEWETLQSLLSDKEGKADIIRKYLPFLNQKINYYLESLGMFINFTLDETFSVTMEAPERKNQSIFSLSSGQRARVNLAILFALRDVANLKASIQTNILVLDEVLENLSERGVIDATTMIKNTFTDANLLVVTQRETEFREHFDDVVKFGLRGGFTTIIS